MSEKTDSTNFQGQTPDNEPQKNAPLPEMEDNGLSSSNLQDRIAQLEKQVQDLQNQKQEWQNNYLYLRAEFENFRRNVEKERQNWRLYGAGDFIRELLEVVDNFERALAHPPLPSQISQFMQGIHMIVKEIQELLNRHGVKAQDCQYQMYDPHIHEAIGQDSDPSQPEGVIIKVLKKPYFIHDRLLRVGQVIVNRLNSAKAGEPAEPPSNDSNTAS